MKIFYDFQIFSSQKYGGISRYFIEIMKNRDYILPIIFNKNNYLNLGIKIEKNFKGQIRLLNFFNKLYTSVFLNKEKYDVFHPTYYDNYFLKNVKSPFVLTIHDMIHEKFFYLLPKKDKTAVFKKELAQKAKRIIAVSQNTKKDIVEILGINEDKIDVVYHGCDFEKISEDFNIINKLPEKYILFTGHRYLYKNFFNFFEAVKDFLKKDSDLYLVCVGGYEFSKEEKKLFSLNGIENKIIHFFCNDSELKTIYKNALFFVFPSMYEGFGMPLLESMSSGCPVLCSNISCFPEIVSDAAVYFDPNNISDIKDKIKYALQNDLNEYIKKGYLRVKQFSWEKAREETTVVYKKAINGL